MDIKCKYYVLTSQHVSYCKLYNMLPISQLRLSTEEGGEQSDLELECVGEERRWWRSPLTSCSGHPGGSHTRYNWVALF